MLRYRVYMADPGLASVLGGLSVSSEPLRASICQIPLCPGLALGPTGFSLCHGHPFSSWALARHRSSSKALPPPWKEWFGGLSANEMRPGDLFTLLLARAEECQRLQLYCKWPVQLFPSLVLPLLEGHLGAPDLCPWSGRQRRVGRWGDMLSSGRHIWSRLPRSMFRLWYPALTAHILWACMGKCQKKC